jgi:hypothetical protein
MKLIETAPFPLVLYGILGFNRISLGKSKNLTENSINNSTIKVAKKVVHIPS